MLSIREQIVEAIKTRLEDMTEPEYAVSFNEVKRQEFTTVDAGKRLVGSIFDEVERRIPDTDPVVRVDLSITIEFLTYIKRDEDPTSRLNLILSEVERALMVDRTFGNLAIDTRVDRTEHDVGGRFNKYPETFMFLRVDYRHNNEDPRKTV